MENNKNISGNEEITLTNKISAMKKFFAGFFMPFKAMTMFMFKPKYWHYMAIPLSINLFIYGVIGILCFMYLPSTIRELFSEPSPEVWYHFVYTIWTWIAMALTIVIYGTAIAFSFSLLFFIIAAPFADMLAEKIEFEIYNHEIKINGIKEYIKLFSASIYDGILLNIKIILVTIALFPLTFIPVIGFLPLFIVSSYFYGSTFLVFSSEHHRVRHKDFFKKMKENRPLCLGLGVCLYLSNYIPLLPIIIYPAGVIAGTMIFNEYLNPQQPMDEK